MMKLLWNLVGAKRTAMALVRSSCQGKADAERQHWRDMLELSCILGLILVMSYSSHSECKHWECAWRHHDWNLSHLRSSAFDCSPSVMSVIEGHEHREKPLW